MVRRILEHWGRPGRGLLAALVLAGGAGGAGGCLDTGRPEAPVATLSLQAELPPSYTPGVFGLSVDRARILLIRSTSEPVTDTTVFFPAELNQLQVRLRVPLLSRREVMTALIELRSGTSLLFAGSQVLTVSEGETLAPLVPMQYVGPGSGITAVRITPRDTALKPGDKLTFEVAAEQSGAPVGQFYVSWSTSDAAIAPIDARGTLTAAGAAGTSVMLRVVSPTGIRDSTRISISPPASGLALIGGDRQTWAAGVQLPDLLVVRALSADGRGVPGVRVSFAALSGGSVREPLVITDAQGYARTAAILGPVAGAQAFQATAPGLAAVGFNATATAGPADRVQVLAGNNQVDSVGTTLKTPLIAQVTDAVGNPVAGVTVTWQVISGGGTLDRTSSVSNLSGIAFADYTLGSTPGQNRVRVQMLTPPFAADFTATALPGGPASLSLVGGHDQTAPAGTTLPLPFVVRVRDRFGNVLQGVPVRWREVQGGGQLSAGVSNTDALGGAQVFYRLPNTPGGYNVVADIPGTGFSWLFTAVATAP